MPLISDRAICLRRHEFSETSQILSLLTERHGLIRVIARGAHRTTKAGASKFDGGIDLLDEGDALFTDRVDKDLNTLAEWKLIDGHRAVRQSQRSLYLALYLAELIGTLFEAQDPHPTVFAGFRSTIEQLATPMREEAALALALDTIGDAGLEPQLGGCVECGAALLLERQVSFSADRGGLLCPRCAGDIRDRIPIDARLAQIASFVQRLPRDGRTLPRLGRRQVDRLHALLARHVEHNTSRPLWMLRWVADPRRGIAATNGPSPARPETPAPIVATTTMVEAVVEPTPANQSDAIADERSARVAVAAS